LNKIDLPDARAKAQRLRGLFKGPVFLVSGATGEGVRSLLQELQRLLAETAPSVHDGEKNDVPVLRPRARDRIEVEQDGDIFVVRGERAEEAAYKLGEGGFEALDELQERLRRMGLERALRRVGARPGDRLKVGNVELEWQG
jgi:GTP-binding protein